MSIEKAVLKVVAESPGGVATEEICRRVEKSPQALGDVFERLLENDELLGFAGLWFTPETFEAASEQFMTALDAAHKAKPKVAAHPRERIVNDAGFSWAGKNLDRILTYLEEEDKVEVAGGLVRSREFRLLLTRRQQEFLDRVLTELRTHLVATPNAYEIAKILRVPKQAVEEVVRLGAQAGDLLVFEDGVLYAADQIVAIQAKIKELFGAKPFTAGELRDALGASRRYVIPLLEYLDEQGFTIRDDDYRTIAPD